MLCHAHDLLHDTRKDTLACHVSEHMVCILVTMLTIVALLSAINVTESKNHTQNVLFCKTVSNFPLIHVLKQDNMPIS